MFVENTRESPIDSNNLIDKLSRSSIWNVPRIGLIRGRIRVQGQKVKRALTCIVRLGTATLLIIEEPGAIAPDEVTERVLAGNPKLG